MKARVCVCCGEPMRDTLLHGSQDPNVCASCSSLLEFGDWFKDIRGATLGAATPNPDPQPAED